ncbi:MAG: alcohol dehydrogenase catalytic domain-containing protein [Chloroflexi bacterium]|nr:alcohol dehydrogenase catalytic domain-containing protein [Chloroflexota bacterium]
MKAWRLHSYGDFRLEDVAEPDVKPGWAKVKVKVVQAAVVEKGLIEKMPHIWQAEISRKLAEGKPVQLGHEYCGEVVEIGQGVTTLKAGDRVCSSGHAPCGTCDMCRCGQEESCQALLTVGVDVPGAFAEYFTLPEKGLVKVPEGPTDNEVAAFQPLSGCVSDVESAEIRMKDTVVVLGQGAMGLGCLQIARVAGAGVLIAVDVRRQSLELARSFGADHVINARDTDPVKEVRRLTGDRGADVVFEAAGGRKADGLAGFETVQQAMQMVRGKGKVVQVANLEGDLVLDSVLLRSKRVRYIFPDRAEFEALRHVAFLVATKRIQIGPQITHVLQGLENLPEAMEITANKAKYGATNPAQIVV